MKTLLRIGCAAVVVAFAFALFLVAMFAVFIFTKSSL